MGTSPEQLESDIRRTREDLGETVDAIEQRLRPSRIARANSWLLWPAGGVLGVALMIRLIRRRRRGRS